MRSPRRGATARVVAARHSASLPNVIRVFVRSYPGATWSNMPLTCEGSLPRSARFGSMPRSYGEWSHADAGRRKDRSLARALPRPPDGAVVDSAGEHAPSRAGHPDDLPVAQVGRLAALGERGDLPRRGRVGRLAGAAGGLAQQPS